MAIAALAVDGSADRRQVRVSAHGRGICSRPRRRARRGCAPGRHRRPAAAGVRVIGRRARRRRHADRDGRVRVVDAHQRPRVWPHSRQSGVRSPGPLAHACVARPPVIPHARMAVRWSCRVLIGALFAVSSLRAIMLLQPFSPEARAMALPALLGLVVRVWPRCASVDVALRRVSGARAVAEDVVQRWAARPPDSSPCPRSCSEPTGWPADAGQRIDRLRQSISLQILKEKNRSIAIECVQPS